jgi:hypothetical protein
MALTYKVWDFPSFGIQSQLFYAGGAAYEAGFTAGGSRLLSPEAGGRSYLEIELSLQVNEYDNPITSWFLSKMSNGTIFKIPLTKTPQLVTDEALNISVNTVQWNESGILPFSDWDNNQPWKADGINYLINANYLEGETTIEILTGEIGNILKAGHVIGIGNSSYIIEDISYTSTIATIDIIPPLRKNVVENDEVKTRPFFVGSVTNASEVKTSYSKENNGHIQPSRILFSEVII